MTDYIVKAPLFPTLGELKNAVRLFADEPVKKVLNLIQACWDLTGTPQSIVDWTKPDEWIDLRLSGDVRELANKIWIGSDRNLNPRHIYGCYLFINRCRLLDQINRVYKLSERSDKFLSDDTTLLIELDAAEGLPKVLSLITAKPNCRYGDLLPEWSEFLKSVSKFSSDSTFRDTLRRRLNHLLERDLISRERSRYTITNKGQNWLKEFEKDQSKKEFYSLPAKTKADASIAIASHNEQERERLLNRLMALEPYQFEHFTKALLDAMGYEDVLVTQYTGDKGVDVIGKVQVGITSVVEVIQVKRTQNTISRPIVDQLRGALYHHNAMRGTIITLGKFAKGALDASIITNAPPITLIDGERLIELCTQNEVGVKIRSIPMIELDEGFFSTNFPSPQSLGETENPIDEID